MTEPVAEDPYIQSGLVAGTNYTPNYLVFEQTIVSSYLRFYVTTDELHLHFSNRPPDKSDASVVASLFHNCIELLHTYHNYKITIYLPLSNSH